jgi:protein phosphatase
MDMRTIGLIAAVLLLAFGLYRLFTEQRKPEKPAAKPGGKLPAPQGSTKREPEKSAPAAKSEAAKSEPAKSEKSEPAKSEKPLPSMLQEHDADEDITIITIAPSPELMAAMNAAKAAPAVEAAAAPPTDPPKLEPPADIDDEESAAEAPSAVPILYDEDAAIDEPTRMSALILVSAASQTDQGRRRRRNEDSFITLEDHHLFVVADGMGGHAGGDVASKMCVETIAEAFKTSTFKGDPYPDVPRRGAELAAAIQMANRRIFEHARANAAYQGMGTTVVSARFSPNKQRMYVGHVGDSRCYRLRAGQLTQITTDHTMGAQGVTGPLASHLNRAVGVAPGVKVDLLIARPQPEDIYLLCTDGLSKMVPDEQIQAILNGEPDLDKAVQALVERANARGGRDNITVILVQVKDPKGLAKYIQDRAQKPN